MSNQEQVAAMAGAMSVLQQSLDSSLSNVSVGDHLEVSSVTNPNFQQHKQQSLTPPPSDSQVVSSSRFDSTRPHSTIVEDARKIVSKSRVEMEAVHLNLRSSSPAISSPPSQQPATVNTRPLSQHLSQFKSNSKSPTVLAGQSQVTLAEDEEEQIRRLKEMFPAAPVQVIGNMIHIYHDLEGLIKAALIALGYRCSPEYTSQQGSAQNHIMLMMSKPSSKKLFEKLSGYFPEKDEALIKKLMFEHKEVEHEIISALVESGLDDSANKLKQSTAASSEAQDRTGVIMKLRYLKHLFPSCEEIELYHLLHCTNLNAQRVIEEVESRGHKPANIDEIMQNRKSRAQQMRAQAASLVSRQKVPAAVNLLDAHLKRVKPVVNDSRVTTLTDNLRRRFPSVDGQLLEEALNAADYSESLAAKFLEEMAPVEEELYKQRNTFYRNSEPTSVLFPCKGIQKGDINFMSVTCNEFVAIEREILECTTALALPKVDASTFTQDDFKAVRPTQAEGKCNDLVIGSMYKRLQHTRTLHLLRQGYKPELRVGSQYAQVCADLQRLEPNSRAQRRDKSLSRRSNAALRCGPNAKLVERIHPFFLKE